MSAEIREINIPFDGFYDSFYSEMIDEEERMYVEHLVEDGRIEESATSEFFDALFRFTDYKKAHLTIAKKYVEVFNDYFEELTEVNLQLSFTELTSPREYNFTTDRIFANANLEALKTLREKVDEEALKAHIRERFTSRDGFISFYSNRLENWPEEVSEWDHNQLCTLIEVFLPEDYRWDMYGGMCDTEIGHTAWEAAVNWDEINILEGEQQ